MEPWKSTSRGADLVVYSYAIAISAGSAILPVHCSSKLASGLGVSVVDLSDAKDMVFEQGLNLVQRQCKQASVMPRWPVGNLVTRASGCRRLSAAAFWRRQRYEEPASQFRISSGRPRCCGQFGALWSRRLITLCLVIDARS